MTLQTVPRYTQDRIAEAGDRAVVVGASMAGLLAGRVLADAFEEVVVLEKDELPDSPDFRRGVPQCRHIHVLHEAGRSTFEDLFPGYGEDLIDAGGLVIDLASDVRFYDQGDFLARGPTRFPMYSASRPLFEYTTRKRVRDFEGVSIRDGVQLTGYRFDDLETTVEGVTIRDEDGAEAEIDADLVVDATGRASRTPDILESRGYETPPTEEVQIDIAYSTIRLDRPPEDRRAYIVMATPPRTRGGAVFPLEDGEWILTLAGVHDDDPPKDISDFSSYAATLPVPHLQALIDWNDAVDGEVVHYPFPSNRKHLYWELDRFPDGFLPIGDVIASFNPLYGQGMSVSALEAICLHHTLATEGTRNIADGFFDRIEPVVEDAWSLAVGADFRFPQTTGPMPTGTTVFNRYIKRLTEKAQTDGHLTEAYLRVVSMERRPSSLFHPRIAWRVLDPRG